MPVFSIIIPVYKVEKYIKDCIESLINQTFGDFEALFTDDCGGDDSIKIVEEYAKNDNRIKVLKHDRNKGVAAARNTALSHASGKYIVCLDPDDWFENNTLEILYHEMTGRDIDFLWFDGKKYYEDTGTFDSMPAVDCRRGYLTISPANIYKLSDYTCFKVFKNNLIKKNDIKWPEDVTLGEDSEFCYKYISLNPKSYIIEDRLYNYRIRNNSIVTNYHKGIVQIEDLFKVVRHLKAFYIEHDIWNLFKPAILALLRKRIELARVTPDNYEKSLLLANNLIEDFNFPQDFEQFNIPAEPLVSVIIPFYNVEKYLEQCINSVRFQSYPHLEIICVDDKGTDKSLKIAEKLGKQDSRIRIIKHNKNKGLGAARNTGLKNATGDYVFFVDSDDWMERDCIKTVIKKFQEVKTDTIWFKSYVYWENSQNRERFWENNYMDIPEGFFNVTSENMFKLTQYVWNKGYRRKFLIDNNLFFIEGVCFEDMEYFLRLYLASPETYMIDTLLYTYRRHETSIISTCTREVQKARDLYTVNSIIYKYLVQNGLWEKHAKDFIRFTYSNINMFRNFPDVNKQLYPIMKDFLSTLPLNTNPDVYK